jgi:hypothetical protein
MAEIARSFVRIEVSEMATRTNPGIDSPPPPGNQSKHPQCGHGASPVGCDGSITTSWPQMGHRFGWPSGVRVDGFTTVFYSRSRIVRASFFVSPPVSLCYPRARNNPLRRPSQVHNAVTLVDLFLARRHRIHVARRSCCR